MHNAFSLRPPPNATDKILVNDLNPNLLNAREAVESLLKWECFKKTQGSHC